MNQVLRSRGVSILIRWVISGLKQVRGLAGGCVRPDHRVASSDDIIESKRAATTDKDLRAFPNLESLRETLESDS